MTTAQPKIYLTFESQAQDWQEGKREQFIGSDIFICVDKSNPYILREIQSAGRKIESLGVKEAILAGENWQEDSQWAFALGFTAVGKLTAVKFTGDQAEALSDKLDIYAFSRDLTNQTPAQLYPESLAKQTLNYLTELAPSAVTGKIIAGEALVEAGWTGIYHVGMASQHPPCLLEVDYNPTGDESAEVATCLVGKGITFDSGGYSIKSSAGMFDMKCDMGGAAVVAGAFALAIKQGFTKRAKLFLCCAENMIAGHAYKLGDILTYKNGVTVEIANTDAEGRLVLADGLMAAGETGAPLIIDAATLTGAAVLATGAEYTAMFTLDDDLANKTKQAASATNEPIWQLPLEPWHQNKCPSAFADTANSTTQKGGGAGGASNAAGFLSRFVPNEGKGWVHLDIAAAYNASSNGLWAAGATGLGIATIAKMMKES